MTDSDKKWFDAVSSACHYATMAIYEFMTFEAEISVVEMFVADFTASSKAPSPIDVDRIRQVTVRAREYRREMEKCYTIARNILVDVEHLTPTLHNFPNDPSYKKTLERIKLFNPVINASNNVYKNAIQELSDPEFINPLKSFKVASTYFTLLVTTIKEVVDVYNSYHKTDDLSLSDVVLPKWLPFMEAINVTKIIALG